MNCQLCEKDFEAYLQNSLPREQRLLMEKHLEDCVSCSENLFLKGLADPIILEEKNEISNPALSDLIMGQVLYSNQTRTKVITPSFWRNFIYATSVAAAIFAGIMAGNFYNPTSLETFPAEMSYMDDGQLEAVNLFLDEN